jgi:hypothetical protein
MQEVMEYRDLQVRVGWKVQQDLKGFKVRRALMGVAAR